MLFVPKVEAIVKPTSSFYVNDYANILSNETEEYIFNKSVALERADGTQIVVVTVPNLAGMSIEDYSIKLAREFQIGSKEKNNGLLLLIAYEERELRIEVGAGLEGIIPDGKVGRFRDQYMLPYLKENDWDTGVKNGYNAFFKEIVTLNNLSVSYEEPVDSDTIDNENETKFTIGLLISVFSGCIIGNAIRRSKNKKKKTFIYLVIWIVLFVIFNFLFYLINIFLILHLIFFIMGRLGLINSSGYYGGSSSRGGSSRGGFSGGGGSFRGGGASGRF